MRHGMFVKEMIRSFMINMSNDLERLYELEKRETNKYNFSYILFIIYNWRIYYKGRATQKELFFLFELASYSITNLTSTLLYYHSNSEYT